MARRIPEYDYSRTIAIAAVVAIHVLAGALAQSSRVEVPAWVRPTDQFLLRLAVPLFAFISGALVWTGKEFGSVAEYGSFLKRRALVVLVPYVLWTGFYYLYVVLETPQTFDLRTLIWHVLVGTATYHLYYVPVIVLGYILAPAARFLYARMPVGLLAGGVAVAMLGPSVLSRTPGMLGNFTSLAANVVLLMPYVACGAWFASLPRGKTGRWVDAGGLAAALVVYGSARWIAAQRLPMPPPASRAIGFAIVASLLVAVVLLARLVASRSRRLDTAAETLAVASYGMYLAHPLFLLWLRRGLASAGVLPSGYASSAIIVGMWVVVFAVTYVVVRALQRSPILVWTVGPGIRKPTARAVPGEPGVNSASV